LLALAIEKILDINVILGPKILTQTWPNVWVTSRILYVHMMDEHAHIRNAYMPLDEKL
jgi:hypothetical protein